MTDRMIDYDRGVVIKQIMASGTEVFMYRKEPGVYYTAHGNEVNPALARLAGFDVDRHEAMRQHQLRAKMASEMIAKELEVENGIGGRVIKEEAAGFKLVDIGKGRYLVEDEHGPLNKGTPLAYAMAKTVFDACVGDVRKKADTPVPANMARGRSDGAASVGVPSKAA